MKKLTAVLLALVMVMGCTAALGESVEKENLGIISVNGEFSLQAAMPEGYRVSYLNTTNLSSRVRIACDDLNRPSMDLIISFDEQDAEFRRLNDLNDEELAALEQTFYDTNETYEITYSETSHGTKLLIARDDSFSLPLVIFSIYEGYDIEFSVFPGMNTGTVSEEDIAMCIQFLSDLDFVSPAK